jgi:hypothetical protein
LNMSKENMKGSPFPQTSSTFMPERRTRMAIHIARDGRIQEHPERSLTWPNIPRVNPCGATRIPCRLCHCLQLHCRNNLQRMETVLHTDLKCDDLTGGINQSYLIYVFPPFLHHLHFYFFSLSKIHQFFIFFFFHNIFDFSTFAFSKNKIFQKEIKKNFEKGKRECVLLLVGWWSI